MGSLLDKARGARSALPCDPGSPVLPSSSTQYRPDIDGLRAIAVMLVLNYHAFPHALPGGFVGVDVFFVISGFLITDIIARELGEKRFSLLGFYARRIRRIFPALIVVLAAVLVLGWLWMLPAAYAQLGSDVFASAAFLANIALLLQSGYFEVESAKKPLLHLWSLGIEEQFYLIWPLILLLAARLWWRVLAVAAVLGVASFALNVALIGRDLLSAVQPGVRIARRCRAGPRLEFWRQNHPCKQLARRDGASADRAGSRLARSLSRVSGMVGSPAGCRLRAAAFGTGILV